MIATHASTPTNTTRYAAATYFSPELTAAASEIQRVDRSVQTVGIASDASR
jgi:hypothetical protein